MNKELTLTPHLRLGGGKLFKQGKINDIGNGSAEVQLAIVATTNDESLSEDYDWTWNYNGNVFVGSSDTINCPMNSETAKLDVEPLDSFKLKVTMHTGGMVNIKLELDGYNFTFTLTTEMLILNAKNPEVLAKTWTLEEDEEPEIPEPETPEPDIEPEEDIPVPDITPVIEGGILKQLLSEYKWYGVCYIAGVLTIPVISLVKLILKIF